MNWNKRGPDPPLDPEARRPYKCVGGTEHEVEKVNEGRAVIRYQCLGCHLSMDFSKEMTPQDIVGSD